MQNRLRQLFMMTPNTPSSWLVALLGFIGGGLVAIVGHYVKRRLDNTAEFKQRRALAVAKLWGSLSLSLRSFKAITPVTEQASYDRFARRAEEAANAFRDTMNENIIYLPTEAAELFQAFWGKLLNASVYLNPHTTSGDEKLYAARADLEGIEKDLLPWCKFLIGDPAARCPPAATRGPRRPAPSRLGPAG